MRWLSPIQDKIEILYGDMRDTVSLEVAFAKASPDEVYNLAGQVFVPTSWHIPAETFDINVGGLARLLNIIERQKPDTRLYQASSSEMYGNLDGLRNEETALAPTSPYGVSKTAAHGLCDVYRARGVFAVGGILFNHESPRRGPEMVTRKITLAAADWAQGKKNKLKLGNMQARRDWGFAGDYIRAMHAMLQQDEAQRLRYRHRRVPQRLRFRGRSLALPGSHSRRGQRSRGCQRVRRSRSQALPHRRNSRPAWRRQPGTARVELEA